MPIKETCKLGGWKKGSKIPKTVHDHCEPIKLAEMRTGKQVAEGAKSPTSNNAHLSLEQVALLLTAEDRKELRKKQGRK